MTQFIDCDALVIGSGAGGAVAAMALAQSGRTPIVLEEGPRVEASDIGLLSGAQALSLLYRHAGLQPVFGSPKVVYGEGRCVGGSTVVNGGLLWFPSEWRVDRWATLRGSVVPSHEALSKHGDSIAGMLSVAQQADGAGNRDSVALRNGATELNLRWQHPQRALVGCIHANRCTMGCPSGAKQTALDTYIASAERLGAVVVPNTRVTRLLPLGKRISEVHAHINGRKTVYRPQTVVLSGGPIGSPEILLRSGLWRSPKRPSMAWHANLRFIAKFRDPVHAELGTIFTTQINEYERMGIYLMPANATTGTLAGFLQGHGPKAVAEYLESPENYAVFTAQVEMKGRISIATAPTMGRLLTHSLALTDEGSLRFAAERMLAVLFASGASMIFPPVNEYGGIVSPAAGMSFSQKNPIEEWQILSVHGMASCPMGDTDRGGIVDERGRLRSINNLHLADASVLPGATGISPQGSIMAIVECIMDEMGR